MRLLSAGDPHGQFSHIAHSAGYSADAVILLGDMEPERPLHEELKPLLERRVPIFWIPGNHDADSDELWIRVWGSELADQNIHGRVIELADGTRVAGLGGVFRESVWHPSPASVRGGEPAFRTRSAHAKATPRQDRWGGTGPHRRHWGSIYPAEVDRLADQRAEILVTREAPGYHPHGFELLDDLARQLGVKVAIHGHHHDALDSSAHWAAQGFQSNGVGLRGMSLLDTSTWQWSVIQPGELDNTRAQRI